MKFQRPYSLERAEEITAPRPIANVPFYRKAFDTAGVHPDDLHSLSDLCKVPFTVKTDLRDNTPFGNVRRAPRPAGRASMRHRRTTGPANESWVIRKTTSPWATGHGGGPWRWLRGSNRGECLAQLLMGMGLFTGRC